MEKLYKVLNQQVANLSVLFTKLHHYHWYVKGPNFFALHAKFEELYDEINELYDEFAERLLTIGGSPASTLKSYLELASIKEAAGHESTMDMVKAVRDDLVKITEELKAGITVSQDLDDEATADLFIGTIASFEKTVWMLNFTLA
jgi:starvation-inducible DNA-binding protein